jgi:hypothetical protein
MTWNINKNTDNQRNCFQDKGIKTNLKKIVGWNKQKMINFAH